MYGLMYEILVSLSLQLDLTVRYVSSWAGALGKLCRIYPIIVRMYPHLIRCGPILPSGNSESSYFQLVIEVPPRI